MKKKVDQELLRYLYKRIPMDVSREEIIQELQGAGWEDEDIFKGFEAYDAGEQPKSWVFRILTSPVAIMYILLFGFIVFLIGLLAYENSQHEHRYSTASIRASLNNSRAQAELYYFDKNDSSYKDVCVVEQGGIAPFVSMVKGVGSDVVNCYDSENAWALEAKLITSPEFYCVDSRGNATTTMSQINTVLLSCPN